MLLLCSRRLQKIQNYANQQNFELEIQNYADPQELPELHADFHADPQTFKFKNMLNSKHLNFSKQSYNIIAHCFQVSHHSRQ